LDEISLIIKHGATNLITFDVSNFYNDFSKLKTTEIEDSQHSPWYIILWMYPFTTFAMVALAMSCVISVVDQLILSHECLCG